MAMMSTIPLGAPGTSYGPTVESAVRKEILFEAIRSRVGAPRRRAIAASAGVIRCASYVERIDLRTKPQRTLSLIVARETIVRSQNDKTHCTVTESRWITASSRVKPQNK